MPGFPKHCEIDVEVLGFPKHCEISDLLWLNLLYRCKKQCRVLDKLYNIGPTDDYRAHTGLNSRFYK